MCPQGVYSRTKKYLADHSDRMKLVMNRPSVIEKERKTALLRWAKYRKENPPEEKIETRKVINPEDIEALKITKDFVENHMEDKDYGRLVIKAVESQNGKVEPKEIKDNYDKYPTDRLKVMAESLESEFSIVGLTSICREAFYSALREERRDGERAKYLMMLRHLEKHKPELEEARRKRRGQ